MHKITLGPTVTPDGVRWVVEETSGSAKPVARICKNRGEGHGVLMATIKVRLKAGVAPLRVALTEQTGYTEEATYYINAAGKSDVKDRKITPAKEGAGIGPRCRSFAASREESSHRRRTLRSTSMWDALYVALAGGNVYAVPSADGSSIARFGGRGAVQLGPEHFVLAQVAIIKDVPGARALGAFPTYAELPAAGLAVKQAGKIAGQLPGPAPAEPSAKPVRAKVEKKPKPKPKPAPKPAPKPKPEPKPAPKPAPKPVRGRPKKAEAPAPAPAPKAERPAKKPPKTEPAPAQAAPKTSRGKAKAAAPALTMEQAAAIFGPLAQQFAQSRVGAS